MTQQVYFHKPSKGIAMELNDPVADVNNVTNNISQESTDKEVEENSAVAVSFNTIRLRIKIQMFLSEMFLLFGNTSFDRNKIQGFSSFPLVLAYNNEECSL